MRICTNKSCGHNGAKQPETNFYRDFRDPTIKQSECKDCVAERRKKYKHRNQNNWMKMYIG